MNEPVWIETGRTALIALAGVGVAAIAVRAFGSEQPRSISAEMALAELEYAFPAFQPGVMLRDHPAGRAVLVLDQQKQGIAAVFRFGTQLVSRCMPAERAVFDRTGGAVTLRLGDMVTPDLSLRLPPQVPPEFQQLIDRPRSARG